ncbi:helical backbone metal receptor [Nocardioides sp. YIM 152315]|uniref:helical backbone metal receptor n=1 Tax=Nocardioides sp. YIM 152315 TaxID=3031760 RepID=UPI0023DB7FB5|nr:helical backbone metal receptor [Nocardioides sp. YIM 152315]MDF1602209.1 helical backbone metal receptor [Nocardioides sp. YIM 152315]
MPATDDLGTPVAVDGVARRVVSLVPSLTETLAEARPSAVIGATDWCTRPRGLDVARVRGTKNPDLSKIALLAPDLVIANQEENRELDVRRLRAAGVPVWVTRIETVPGAIQSIERLFDEALRWPRPGWLRTAREQWCGPLTSATKRVAVAIWRDPWMFVGPRTFTGDLIRRLGYENVLNEHEDRYPTMTVAEIEALAPGLVLLPDEPYEFSERDGPEAFGIPTQLVSGRLITWYGPSLLEARQLALK